MNIATLQTSRDAFRRGTLSLNQTPAWFASEVDQWVAGACASLLPAEGPTMVLALGGYGRGELHPYSDIDLLVCLPESDPPDTESLAQALFLPLWDSGFDVGHGIRSVAETLELASGDFEVLFSLLDARLLFGPDHEFQRVRGMIREQLVLPRRAALATWLADRQERRHRRFGEGSHMLSPNLKEGRGGQRDAQSIHWLENIFGTGGASAVFLSPDERRSLAESELFLGLVRTALHRASQRKNDVMHLELQPELAQTLGYGPCLGTDGVERFLSDLHRAMSDIRLLCGLCLDKASCASQSCTGSEPPESGLDFSVLVSDPANVLELFRHSSLTRTPISWHTRRIIQGRFPELSQTGGWQVSLTPRFESILCSEQAGFALEQMLEVGFLRMLLPEFAAVEHLVQFDAYHRLPAGPHLVETVRQLTSFSAGHDFFGDALVSHRDTPVLRWAALLHDIGKGGGDHSLRGAELARALLLRLGYGSDFVEECVFLIRHHLLLVHTATRRDLGEESVILALAATLGTVRRLEALTLLTWADSAATGPKAWNPWVENLLRETYLKTRKVLEYGFLSDEHRVHRLSKLRDTLRSLRPPHLSVSEFEGYLSVMPPRYLMQTSSRRILEHIEFVRGFRSAQPRPAFHLFWEHKAATRSLRLTLVSLDRPGLFARVCAALARYRLSVLGAELCVWDDRTVVDVFWVSEPLDPLYVDQTVQSFRSALARLFDDESGLDSLLVAAPPKLKKVFGLDGDIVQVHVDNEASDFHTVLSIHAPDIPGLLATVSLALYRLGIDLVLAKIATQKDKAVDILHVREGGEKIADGDCDGLARSLRLIISSLYA